MDKTTVIIAGKKYLVGFSLCAGCEQLAAGGVCLFPGDGCEYPDHVLPYACPKCGQPLARGSWCPNCPNAWARLVKSAEVTDE